MNPLHKTLDVIGPLAILTLAVADLVFAAITWQEGRPQLSAVFTTMALWLAWNLIKIVRHRFRGHQ